MKYYLVIGKVSRDPHASQLMMALKRQDNDAQLRLFGGDFMAAAGEERVRHFKEVARMGFIPVPLHLRTIFKNMEMYKEDIARWQPDVVISVDYADFNLNITKFLKINTSIPAYCYISPKFWAWKEYRTKDIKRGVAELFSILPFEVPFFEKKHHYPTYYIGSLTADEVRRFRASYTESSGELRLANHFNRNKPITTLPAGGRKQEVKDNLSAMIQAINAYPDYQPVLAGAPFIEDAYYEECLTGTNVALVKDRTCPLLARATVALVVSSATTLETALFDVPQVVYYKTPVPRLIRLAFEHITKVKRISLVSLITDQEVVRELLADCFTLANIVRKLGLILPSGGERQKMPADYVGVRHRLDDHIASENAVKIMVPLSGGKRQ